MRLQFSPFPELITERLLLRQLLHTDAEAISSLRSNDQVNQYLDRPKKTTIDGAVQFIEKINAGITNNQSAYWAICLKENRSLIGTICLWNFDTAKHSAEIGYELHPDFHGKAIMLEALRSVIDFAFDQVGLDTINAFTIVENKASIKLLDRYQFNIDPAVTSESPDEIGYSLKRPIA